MGFDRGMLHKCLVVVAIVLVPLGAATTELPEGWVAGGSNPAGFEMGVVKEGARSGRACAVVRSKAPDSTGFGTLMQNADPKPYLGKRVRLTAWVKAENVTGRAGIWFRVDKGKDHVSFDNMQDRPIQGTFDWKKVEVVLDVPRGSTKLAYGVLLNGSGAVWVDDFKFEKVSKKVKITGKKVGPPQNLGFEK